MYLDQQLVAIAAGFPRQLQLQRQLPAGILNCERLVSFHTCRSVRIMAQAAVLNTESMVLEPQSSCV